MKDAEAFVGPLSFTFFPTRGDGVIEPITQVAALAEGTLRTYMPPSAHEHRHGAWSAWCGACREADTVRIGCETAVCAPVQDPVRTLAREVSQLSENEYDVVIVGGSLAGCAAATLLGRAGRRVAVLESHTDHHAYKKICTTVIQPSTVPALQRLGLDQSIEAAGGVRIGIQVWTRWGWITPPKRPEGDSPFHGYDIRREKLDPMVRSLAISTSGVELLMGHNVREVLRSSNGRVVGVRAERQDGSHREVTARLVVAADGRNSSVAKSAGVKAWTVRRHERACYFAFYKNVSLPGPGNAHLWFLEPDIAYAFPHDDDLFVLACMFTKDKLPAFKRDIEGNFARFLQGVPEFPHFDPAERVSRVFGLTDHPNTWRRRPPPGLAFIGDAAVSADYLWGVGCGWAFRSAEWLAESARDSFTTDHEIDAAVRRYRRRLRREIAGHFLLISDYSTGRPYNPIEKLMFSASTRDERLAAHTMDFGARAIPVRKFLAPSAIARAVRVNLTHPQSAQPTGTALSSRCIAPPPRM